MHVITAQDDHDNGCIANTCVQVASSPDHLVISMQMGNLTREMIERTGMFNVSVLTEDVPFETIRHFGMQTGREVDKFEHYVGFDRSANGVRLNERGKALYQGAKASLAIFILIIAVGFKRSFIFVYFVFCCGYFGNLCRYAAFPYLYGSYSVEFRRCCTDFGND